MGEARLSDPDDPLIGRTLGDLRLLEKLGVGGHAVVYLAEQPNPGRTVVVKVLRARFEARSASTRRFLREVQLAATFDHPYAAHIYAYGAEPDGLLWFAMELVRGTPLDMLLRAQGPIAPARLAPLLERIAEVVDHAHGRGIVHCDLKPANVMILDRAGRLFPKLLDFGVARVVDGPDDGAGARGIDSGLGTLPMTTGQDLAGTPPYMAPELWGGAPAEPSADLYALGVLAFEAVSGGLPFQAEHFEGMARAHREDPVPQLPGELAVLDRFFARALAKVPKQRFANALEMAAAFTAATGQPQRRRRRRIALAIGVGAAMLALVLGGVAVISARSAGREARRARAQQAQRALESGQRAVLDGDPARALGFLAEAHHSGVDSPSLYFLVNQAERSLGTLERALPHGADVTWVDVSPDGSRLAAAVADGRVVIWPRSGVAPLATMRHGARADTVQFSADGSRLVSCSLDGTVIVWDGATWAAAARFTLDGRVTRARISPRGDFAIAETQDGALELLDVAGGTRRTLIAADAATPRHVTASIGPRDEIAAMHGGTMRLFDRSGAEVWTVPVHGGRWSAAPYIGKGSRYIALAGSDGTVAVADLLMRELDIVGRHKEPISSVSLSGDDLDILSASDDGSAVEWGMFGGPPRRFDAHGGNVMFARHAAGDRRVVTASSDGIVRVWDTGNGSLHARLLGHEGAVRMFALDAAGKRAFTAGQDGMVRVFDLGAGDPLLTLEPEGVAEGLGDAHFTTDGSVVSVTASGRVRSWDLDTARAVNTRWLHVEQPAPRGAGLAIARSGREAGFRDRSVLVADGTGFRELGRHDAVVTGIGWIDDGTRLATVSEDGALRIWNADAVTGVVRSIAVPEGASALAISPDGTRAATGGTDQVLRIWDLASGRELAALAGHRAPIAALTWNADGTRLASASWDQTGRVYRVSPLAVLATLVGHTAGVEDVAFSADGALLATAGWDRTARLWDPASGALLTTLEAHATKAVSVEFSPDSTRLLTSSQDGLMRVWDVSHAPYGRGEVEALAACFAPQTTSAATCRQRPQRRR